MKDYVEVNGRLHELQASLKSGYSIIHNIFNEDGVKKVNNFFVNFRAARLIGLIIKVS